MAVSISDLQVLIEASVKAALAGQSSATTGCSDERHFRGMTSYRWGELEGVFSPVQDSGGLSQHDDAWVLGRNTERLQRTRPRHDFR